MEKYIITYDIAYVPILSTNLLYFSSIRRRGLSKSKDERKCTVSIIANNGAVIARDIERKFGLFETLLQPLPISQDEST